MATVKNRKTATGAPKEASSTATENKTAVANKKPSVVKVTAKKKAVTAKTITHATAKQQTTTTRKTSAKVSVAKKPTGNAAEIVTDTQSDAAVNVPAPAKKQIRKRKTAETPAQKVTSEKSEIKNADSKVQVTANVNMLPRDFMIELAQTIKDAVEPHARSAKGREIVSKAQSGDPTFQLDRYAEKALLNFLKSKRMPIAYYSEDAGYTTFTSDNPHHLLIVDPVDGSRAAKSGFEGCVVALTSTRVMERPTIANLDNACVMEILGDRTFYAEKGKGVRIWTGDQAKRPKLSLNEDLEKLTWSMTVPARPAELIFPTAGKLIDISSLKGGFFACNSTSYSLTRLLTGQLDACVDFANRYYRDIPELVRDHFINAGRGSILGIAPYDIAAALLIAEEAGCVVTDAYGKRFDDVLLLDNSEENQQTLIAAGNSRLHRTLLRFIDKRIKQFEQLYLRRNSNA